MEKNGKKEKEQKQNLSELEREEDDADNDDGVLVVENNDDDEEGKISHFQGTLFPGDSESVCPLN